MGTAVPIRDRVFGFACDVIAVVGRLPHSQGIHVIANQLVKSATSIGANLEEAKAASSRREFARFVDISLREAREAHYWLRIIAHAKLAPEAALTPLLIEADKLIRILTAIAVNTKHRGLGP